MILALALSALLFPQAPASGTNRPHRSFRFVYDAAVPEVPAGAKQVRLWIPIPIDTPDQTIRNLTVSQKSAKDSGSLKSAAAMLLQAKTPDELQKDFTLGGVTLSARDVQGGTGRSLCIETPGQVLEVELAFDVTRYETKGGGKATAEELAHLTQPEPMIPLNGKVAAIAASLTTPKDAKQIARALYDNTLERMKYDKPEGDKGWGRGDAEWACDSHYGNCTDFHSYFMGLARSKGLPARFEMGFPIPVGGDKEAKVGGYHCWAYVWIEGQGWMPVDISEADKHPEKTEYFFGTLDADRVMMTGGRDLTLTPTPAAGKLNFFVYPYAEVDGKKAENVTKAFKRIDP